MKNLELINLNQLTKQTIGSSKIKIGLIDGPVHLNHPDLEKKGIINISKSLSANQNRKNGRFSIHANSRTNYGGKMPEQFEMLLKKMGGFNGGFNKIAVPTAEGFELIPATEVVYFEADSNYTHIFLKNKNKIIACRTLKKIEEQIQDYNCFVRVHNSYMVNLNEVVRYVRGEGGYLVMSDNSSVNVSRNRKDALLKFF